MPQSAPCIHRGQVKTVLLLEQMGIVFVFFSSHIDEKMLQRGAQQYSKRANDGEAITTCEDTVFPRAHEADPSCQLFHVFCNVQFSYC